MAGHADSEQGETDASRHFHIDKSERNRNSQAVIQDIVQKGIARVIVVFTIAAQLFFFEEHRIERVNGLGYVTDIANPSGDSPCDCVHAVNVRIDVELRILGPRDSEGSTQQVDALVLDLLSDLAGQGLGGGACDFVQVTHLPILAKIHAVAGPSAASYLRKLGD